MAFSFGQNKAPTFGAGPSPFGASAQTNTPAPSFGGQQQFTFGAQPTPAPFGAQSAPAQPTPLFGGPSAPANPFTFGLASQGAFSFSLQPSAPAFSFGGASAGPSPLPPQPGGLSQQQAQQNYGGLTTLDGKPVQKTTKWEEMSPSSQQFFLQMQKHIDEQKDAMRILEADQRLNSQPHEMLPGKFERLRNRLGAINNRLDLDNDRFDDDRQNRFTTEWKTLFGRIKLWRCPHGCLSVKRSEEIMSYHESYQIASRVFGRSKAWPEACKLLIKQGQPVPVSWQEHMMLPVELPSPVLERVVHRLVEQYERLHRLLSNLERGQPKPEGPGDDLPSTPHEALQSTIENTWDAIEFAAGRLARLRDKVAALQASFLARRRKAGDNSDPFAEAAQRDEQQRRATEATRAAERRAPHTPAAPPTPSFAHPAPAPGPLSGLPLPAPSPPGAYSAQTLGLSDIEVFRALGLPVEILQSRGAPPQVPAGPGGQNIQVPAQPLQATRLGFGVPAQSPQATQPGFGVPAQPPQATQPGFGVPAQPPQATRLAFQAQGQAVRMDMQWSKASSPAPSPFPPRQPSPGLRPTVPSTSLSGQVPAEGLSEATIQKLNQAASRMGVTIEQLVRQLARARAGLTLGQQPGVRTTGPSSTPGAAGQASQSQGQAPSAPTGPPAPLQRALTSNQYLAMSNLEQTQSRGQSSGRKRRAEQPLRDQR